MLVVVKRLNVLSKVLPLDLVLGVGVFEFYPLPNRTSEMGRIWFHRVRFQTPNSVSFLALAEFRGESSVSSSHPIISVPKRTHRVFCAELTEFGPKLIEAQ